MQERAVVALLARALLPEPALDDELLRAVSAEVRTRTLHSDHSKKTYGSTTLAPPLLAMLLPLVCVPIPVVVITFSVPLAVHIVLRILSRVLLVWILVIWCRRHAELTHVSKHSAQVRMVRHAGIEHGWLVLLLWLRRRLRYLCCLRMHAKRG